MSGRAGRLAASRAVLPLVAQAGYVEVEPVDDDPHVSYWLEKRLAP